MIRKLALKVFTVFVVLLITAKVILAGTATLSWDPNTEPDLAGYKVHYGTVSSSYAYTIDVGTTSTPSMPGYTVNNLAEGNIYYFAVTAYGTSGSDSSYSNEVSKTIPGQPPTFPLTVTRSGPGGGTVTASPAGINCGLECSEPYNTGTLVTLTATPDSGYNFSGWGGDCAFAGTFTTCLLSMNSNKTVTVTFVSSGGLKGEYYGNADLAGPFLTRFDPYIDFDWGDGSPAPPIGPDTFSSRWSGKIKIDHSDFYIFNAVTDDGARLWIDGNLVIDNWHIGVTSTHGTMKLDAGEHDIKLEFFESAGEALSQLYWSSPSTPYGIIPQDHLYPPASTGNAPVFSWTGEDNYTSDGLDPQFGDITSSFTYRVKYADADGNAPMADHPRVHILKGGQEISGSPFAMQFVNGNYIDGAIYSYSLTLPDGTDYIYYFDAKDTTGLQAVATAAAPTPTAPFNAPDVEGKVILGDLDGSGRVDEVDLRLLGRSFGSKPGDPLWNPEADLNGDGMVDGTDNSILMSNFGKKL